MHPTNFSQIKRNNRYEETINLINLRKSIHKELKKIRSYPLIMYMKNDNAELYEERKNVSP